MNINIIACDIETFYSKEYGLTKCTTEEYIRSPLFQTIGVATKINDGSIEWVSGTHEYVKEYLESLPWDTHLLLAQNTAFDGAILNWIYGIKPRGYLDTMSMANALHGVSESSSLANLCKLYKSRPKGDEVLNALGKRREDFTPTELATYGEYCRDDVFSTHDIFHKMLPIFPKSELKVIDLTIRMFAQPIIEIDAPMLVEDLINIKRTKRESLEKLQTALGVGSEAELKTKVMSNPKFAELLKAQGVEPPTKISAKTGKTAWAFAKTDEEFTNLLESDDPIVATLVSTRLENKSTIGETRTEAYIGIAGRGTYPFSLSYSGAKITHRWSGFGTNPQNLPRGSTLRRALVAPDGRTLVVADSSNIELRSGMWLAGQQDALQQIRDGLDLYRVFASESFNLDYDSIGKTSDERFIGKVCQLSLLYQTGHVKLQNTIRIQSKGKITITLKEAERLKYLYRDTYDKIVDAWGDGEEVLSWIANDEEHTAFEFLPVHGKKGILKPSGLYLPYPGLRKENTEKGNEWQYDTRRGCSILKDKAYGGKCFQRINQSLARDIISTQTMEINKRYWVAGLVHDEVICVVPDAEVEEAKIFIQEVMRKPPSWALDLPLDCEVGSGKRYGDAK
jgi:DNA polymerase I-like protein with 3'-5' exonuclease and polymerase domains